MCWPLVTVRTAHAIVPHAATRYQPLAHIHVRTVLLCLSKPTLQTSKSWISITWQAGLVLAGSQAG